MTAIKFRGRFTSSPFLWDTSDPFSTSCCYQELCSHHICCGYLRSCSLILHPSCPHNIKSPGLDWFLHPMPRFSLLSLLNPSLSVTSLIARFIPGQMYYTQTKSDQSHQHCSPIPGLAQVIYPVFKSTPVSPSDPTLPAAYPIFRQKPCVCICLWI